MNGALVQSRIWYGYKKAANRVGQIYSQYRSNMFTMPIISLNNLISDEFRLVVSIDFKMIRSRPFGVAREVAILDFNEVQVGDYFVGQGYTYFLCGIQPYVEATVIYCNAIATVTRTSLPQTKGFVGYGGLNSSSETIIPVLTGWPASILQKGRREMNRDGIPASMPNRDVEILLPNIPNLVFEPGDIITDQNNLRYAIVFPEITDNGWRISATEVMA